jgi:hypothetical protein
MSLFLAKNSNFTTMILSTIYFEKKIEIDGHIIIVQKLQEQLLISPTLTEIRAYSILFFIHKR